MNNAELTALLDRLRAEPREAEWLEFKANRYEPQVLGEYLSALANSACLQAKPRAYLVFGIEDGTHAAAGTTFDPQAEKGKGEQLLPLWLSRGLHPNVGFEMHPFIYAGARVVLFEIHPAFDRPVEFYGTAYVRDGTSKTELRKYPEKERAIWQSRVDWSAQVCEQATLDDLDSDAVIKARREYTTKFPRQADEVGRWDDATFLNKAKLTIKGAVTHAALLLLGRAEATTLLAPAVARITWMLKNERNEDLDYEHFGPPLLLNVDRVLARIRNLTLRALPDGTLFPVELTQYDPWVIREALHNCIAHQDYGLRGRVQVVETPDSLLLTNVGGLLARARGNGDRAGRAAGDLPQPVSCRCDGEFEHDRHARRRHQAHVPEATGAIFPDAGLRPCGARARDGDAAREHPRRALHARVDGADHAGAESDHPARQGAKGAAHFSRREQAVEGRWSRRGPLSELAGGRAVGCGHRAKGAAHSQSRL